MSDEEHGTGQHSAGGLAAFERMLDVHGGDAQRWPASWRAAAAVLLGRPDAEGVTARRVLAEARALDRLLATPPVFTAGKIDSLAARIGRAARPHVPPISVAANVQQLPLQSLRRPVRAATRSGRLAAPAVLAASLLIGVFIGPGNTGLPALQDVADALGLGVYVDQLALAPADYDSSPDEDVL